MYGENGNMRALVKKLEQENINVSVIFKSIEDTYDLSLYDFIYIGTGTDENYKLALADVQKNKDQFIKAIANKQFILVTGNALDLFSDAKILNFTSKQVDFRIIGEQVFATNLISEKIIGFQNRNRVISSSQEEYLFEVITGTGYNPDAKEEGIHHLNFYGTYLLGPILIRNPYFLDYLIKELLISKSYPYQELPETIAYQAYHEFLKNFVNPK